MRTITPTSLMTLILAGCMVGPDYERPTSNIPPSFRFELKGERGTANTEWWRQFGDPQLDALIQISLSNNWTLQTAAAQIEQAAGILMSTRSGLYPQLGYGAGAQRYRFSEHQGLAYLTGTGTHDPQNLFQVFLDSSWEIDLWGRIRRQSEAAQAGLVGTEEARRGVVLSLVASVATAYLQLRSLDAQLDTSKQTLSAYGDIVRLFTNQHKYGEVSMLNVSQARAQYQSAAATIPQLEAQIGQAEDALSLLLGRNPEPIPRGKPLAELTLVAVPAALPSELLRRRPDIAEAEQSLIAANADIGAARALYYPDISLTGAFGFASNELKHVFEGPAQVWSVAGMAAGPIFTGGNVAGQVNQAEAVHKQALATYQQTIQTAFGDVSDALIGFQKGMQQLAEEEKLVQALKNTEHLAWLQYREGYEPYVTVLNAQTELFAAEITEAQVRGTAYADLVNIYKALGGGWVDKATAATPAPRATPALAFP
jgi:outer membrane protein, multidrug efflux system